MGYWILHIGASLWNDIYLSWQTNSCRFPQITNLSVNFTWKDEWMKAGTHALYRKPMSKEEFHIFGFQKLSIKCLWELPLTWLPIHALYDFVYRDVKYMAIWLHKNWHKQQLLKISFSPLMSTTSQSIGPCNPNIPMKILFGIALSLFLWSCQDQSSDSVTFHPGVSVRHNPIVLLSSY